MQPISSDHKIPVLFWLAGLFSLQWCHTGAAIDAYAPQTSRYFFNDSHKQMQDLRLPMHPMATNYLLFFYFLPAE